VTHLPAAASADAATAANCGHSNPATAPAAACGGVPRRGIPEQAPGCRMVNTFTTAHVMAPSSCCPSITARVPLKSLPLPARSGRPLGLCGAGRLVTPATRSPADTCFTGREGAFMIRTGDGGGARRELRSSPTVPAQRGTGGCVPHDCDLTVAGIPADGVSCRYCHGVTHTARNDGRDVPEPVRLAHRYQCRGNSVYTITGRRSLGLDPPEFPQFLADRGQAGQLSPAGDRLRRYRITVRARGGRNREDPQLAPAEIVGALHAAAEVGRRLVTYTAQCACPRRPRPYCRDSAGAGPWEDRAGRCPLPGSTDRRLTGIPRLLAGAIPSPRRARCPDPAPLTTTSLRLPAISPAGPAYAHARTPHHTTPALFTTDVPATLAGRR